MNTRNGIVTALAAALVLAPLAGFAQGGGGAGGKPGAGPARMEAPQGTFDRDRVQDRSRDMDPAYERNRDQDRLHAPGFSAMKNRDIYGNELMTSQERKAYRKALAGAASAEERARIEATHRKEMQLRAEKKGVAIEPPGKDIYGGALMSVEERNRYREELKLIGKDTEKRTRFMADHKEKMQLRASARGVVIDEGGEVEEAE